MNDDAASTSSEGNCRQCRICWGEEGDAAIGLALVSPCKCAGTLNFMHERCLHEWQQVLRSQGQYRKARHCEICKQPYNIKAAPSCSANGGRGRRTSGWVYISQLLSRSGQQLLDLLHCPSYVGLLYRGWKLYILGSSVLGAARAGLVGMRAGFGMGKTLVEEQTSILLHLLGALGELLGTPYAELLWVQAVAAVAFALVSELLYTSMLGLLAGGVIGFFRGYLTAVQASCSLALQGLVRAAGAGRGLAKAAGLALRLPLGALRAAAAVAARKLALRVL